jgi:hypothetical protein
MVHKPAIALATVSAITLGSTLSASAFHGGAGGFRGGLAHPGFTSSGFTRPGLVHPGFRDHFAFRHHRFFRDRFFFAGDPFYDDDTCIERVRTRWGWRWVNFCY